MVDLAGFIPDMICSDCLLLEATNPTTQGRIHMDVASDHLQDRSRGHQIPQNHTVSFYNILQCEIERPRRTGEMGIDLGLLGHLGRERFAEQTFGATATEALKQLKPPPGVVLIISRQTNLPTGRNAKGKTDISSSSSASVLSLKRKRLKRLASLSYFVLYVSNLESVQRNISCLDNV